MNPIDLLENFNFALTSLAMDNQPIPEGVEMHPDTLAALEAHCAGMTYDPLVRRDDGRLMLGPCAVRLSPKRTVGDFRLMATAASSGPCCQPCQP